MLKKPPVLRPNANIALVAPAFSFDRKLFDLGVEQIEKRYSVQTTSLGDIHTRHAYFAGTDERRAQELLHWLVNPNVHALLAVRGGYGCARFYPDLISEIKKMRKKPKPKIVAGYSDLTTLLNGLTQDLGWATFHSPVVVGKPFLSPHPLEHDTFHRSLFTTQPLGKLYDASTRSLVNGKARGALVGGCLSLLVSSLGTSYEIDTDGKILFIEEVDERPYRIDRMLTQLLHAKKFQKVKGVVFGQMHLCNPPDATKEPSQTTALQAIELAIGETLRKRKIPTLLGFPAGHGSPQATFALGVRVEIRAESKNPCLVFLESGVSPR